jgi:peroxiredoxin Q/BCP
MKHSLLALALAALGSLFLQDSGGEPGGPPKVGDPAPSFRLNDQDGHATRIGGPRERWTILAFYPKALTPG